MTPSHAVVSPPPAGVSPLPVPPFELANRVAALPVQTWEATFEAIGAGIRRDIDRLLPAGWIWEGKRALDFGSGAGRALRHFHDLVADNEFWGCDIHAESIDWLNEHLAPMRGVVCGEAPGLPLDDGSLDLIWASSVFTHLTDHWSGWLLELHRLLDEGGILIATFLGDAMAQPVFGEEWDDALIGMNVSAYEESFDVGGPNVLMSPWWIQAHWGRAFDILRIEPSGFTGVAGHGQGIIVARKRLIPITAAELERPEHGEPREWTALVHQRTQLYREMLRWRGRARHLEVALQVAERNAGGLAAPAVPAALPEDVQVVLDLAPQVIAENHQLAEQVVELAREAADLEREIERLKALVPEGS